METSERIELVAVSKCARCGESHQFPIRIVVRQQLSYASMPAIGKENSFEVTVRCPKKGENLILMVPIQLGAGEFLMSVKEG